MTYPIPGVGIGTPYGKRGSNWSCQEDSRGRGIHTGVDFPAPNGTKIYAPIAGQIRHRSYGSAFGRHQFAISPDDDQPFGKGEVFFAHTRTRLPDGRRVEIGDFIAEVGSEGNVTGPHLHMEYMPKTKGTWRCGIHADPAPVLEHGGGGGSASGPYVTKDIYSNKLGYGEPTNGDADSDTIKELQERLNRISLTGGQTLVVNGRYDDDTDDEVRKWQEQIVYDDPDPEGQSYLGVAQRKAMFPSPPYVIHDAGLPAIAGGTPPPPPPPEVPDEPTTLGAALSAAGFVVHDTNVPLGRETTWRGVEFLMVHHTGSPAGTKPENDARWIRSGNADAPLAQLMLDEKGEVWVCCRERDGQPDPGRASHAGSGKGFGVPDDKMNEVSLGIEVCNNGSVPLASNPAQYEVLIRLLRFLSERYGVPTDNVIGHKEWSDTGKVDPRDDMDTIRADVAGTTTPPPEPPEPPVTDKKFIYHYGGKPSTTQEVGTSYTVIDKSTFTPPGDGLLIAMQYLNAAHTFDSGVNEAGFRVRVVREAYKGQEVDYSGYGDFTPNRNLTKPGEFLLTHIWFEMSEGGRPLHWEIDRASQFGKFTLGTRYSKWVWISSDVLNALGRLLGLSARDVGELVAGYLSSAGEAPDEPRTVEL